MAELSPQEVALDAAFRTHDKIIKQCTLPVEQGVALARSFGELARVVGELFGQHAGINKPKLEAVPPVDDELEEAKAMAKAVAAENVS
jgi:hypothetical protein